MPHFVSVCVSLVGVWLVCRPASSAIGVKRRGSARGLSDLLIKKTKSWMLLGQENQTKKGERNRLVVDIRLRAMKRSRSGKKGGDVLLHRRF